MTRRDFFRFFVIGGILGHFGKKLKVKPGPKKARFWRKTGVGIQGAGVSPESVRAVGQDD